MTDSGPSIPRPHLSRRELRRLREASGRPSAALAEAPQPDAGGAASGPATILTVCTGNICRSPMGEVLLRQSLRDLRVRVHSAGTHALVDQGMTPEARRLAVELGADAADAEAHRARYLDEPILAETDLVLTMTRQHRSHVVQMMPSMLKRTFTVREFARLASTLTDADARASADAAGTDSGARVRGVALAVGAQRGLVPGSPEDDDVIDPYRRSAQTYRLSASQLAPALEEVERILRAALR